LGVAIGTDVQAYDAQLADIAGLTPTDGNIIIGDGANFVTESGATARTSLGVAIGTDVQAYDSNLTSFVGTFTLPTVDGNADQVLTTNGSGSLVFADAGGGGGQLDITAGENVTAGDALFYNSSNQVVKLVQSQVTTLTGSGETNISSKPSSLGDPNYAVGGSNGIVVLVARNSSNYLVALAYKYNASTGAWTSGAETNIYTGTSRSNRRSMQIVYNKVADSYIVSFSDVTNYPRRVIFTVDPTSLSITSSQTAVGSSGEGGSHSDVAVDQSNGRVAMVHHGNSYGTPRLSVFTNTSGTTVSGAHQSISVADFSDGGLRIVADSTNSKFHILSQQSLGSASIVNFSYDGSTSPTVGSAKTPSGSQTVLDDYLLDYGTRLEHHVNTGDFLVGSPYGGSYLKYLAISYNNTADTYAYEAQQTGWSSNFSSYSTNRQSSLICHNDSSDYFYVNGGPEVRLATWDGSSFTSIANDTGTGGYNYYLCYDKDNLNIVMIRATSSNSWLEDWSALSTNSNLFVGFADNTVTSGNVVTVNTTGFIDSNRTGLTAGTKYYISTLGELTTSDSGTSAGTALTSTRLLINTGAA
jgi:hypothetical protein